MANFPEIVIPADLLPIDGRFGAGPSKVRPEQIQALVEKSVSVMGTSHRQKPVKNEVAALRAGLAEMFTLPAGYEVVIGNGGTTAFWEIATFGLLRDRAQFLTFGEFGSKFASSAKAAPFLGESLLPLLALMLTAHHTMKLPLVLRFHQFVQPVLIKMRWF